LFLLGLALFAAAMLSPIGTLARGYLFSAHMIQHLLLLLVVPALVLLGLPKRAANHPDTKEPIGNPGLTPGRAAWCWIAGVGGMWFWHVPALCNAAAVNPWVQRLQTVSLLAMGILFWRPVLDSRQSRQLGPLAGVGYLFTACMACTLLGILITFWPVEVCAVYHHPADPLGILPLIRQNWGLTPSADQQLGGLMMWVPACLIYLSGVLGQLARWYGGSDEAETISTFAAVAKAHPGKSA